MDTTDSNAITKNVRLLETIAHGLSEAYRSDLEKELGENFEVQRLTCYDWLKNPEDHFYKVTYKERDSGIILPIPKQAFISDRYITGASLENISKVLDNRGYSLFFETLEPYNLVRIAQQKRKGNLVIV